MSPAYWMSILSDSIYLVEHFVTILADPDRGKGMMVLLMAAKYRWRGNKSLNYLICFSKLSFSQLKALVIVVVSFHVPSAE